MLLAMLTILKWYQLQTDMEPLVKPNIIVDYNANMSGLDRSDQMLSYHSSLHKTVRWYKKVGVHILELLLVNAHYLYGKYSGRARSMKINVFKEFIIKKLVGELKKAKGVHVRANFHYVTHIPPMEKKSNPSQECKHCSNKNDNPRRESRFLCAFCPTQPACVDPCFRLWHQNRLEENSSSSDSKESNDSTDSDGKSDSINDETDE